MPGQQIEIENTLTRALITAEILGVSKLVNEAIFKHIHVDKQRFESIADVKNVFMANKISPADFDNTFNSFMVSTEVKKMNVSTEKLRSQGIHGVPTLIINGKYKAEPSKFKNIDQYKALISYLLNKDTVHGVRLL